MFPYAAPIAFQEFDAQKYREFVRTLSDEALIKEGSAFDEQLKICREEYRRRHPKIKSR